MNKYLQHIRYHKWTRVPDYFIYKKFKKEPIGDCGCCANKGNKLVKDYHKKYKK